MTSSHEQIQKDHNMKSPAIEKAIQDGCNRLAEIDAIRAELNDESAEIRAGWKDMGLVPQAVMSKYVQFKKMRLQKEGYKQSEEIAFEALNKMDQRNLFADLNARDEEKEKAKEAKPKKEKSVGEQQAEAITKSLN